MKRTILALAVVIVTALGITIIAVNPMEAEAQSAVDRQPQSGWGVVGGAVVKGAKKGVKKGVKAAKDALKNLQKKKAAKKTGKAATKAGKFAAANEGYNAVKTAGGKLLDKIRSSSDRPSGGGGGQCRKRTSKTQCLKQMLQ